MTHRQAVAYAIIALENLINENMDITISNLYSEMDLLFDMYTNESIEEICYLY